ncbi:H-2 class I histocompatibility antigen, Q9 alpha chain-like isoform X2 [Thamnophis elegans]|uniref:H-2 class I histocompatibility antigen, Q9 alpha chain-like isoform X2 n=1 Tax=Thamnophis elegans TaxID=35005 RepID=UPI00137886C0|nr:H-2 class I histocompatibility antigen, Q9 alpha chain-like isoform X2 [Thamnophis elegans]
MALRSATLWFLVLEVVALPQMCLGSSSHSLKHFSTFVLEPSQGQPHFLILGYVDDQVFIHYDSNGQKMHPRVSWMEEMKKANPQLWDEETEKLRGFQDLNRYKLEFLNSAYNQSEGFHTQQWMYGCEVRSDGSKEGFIKYGYDGRNFLTFNKETLTWVAHQPQAQIIKEHWNDLLETNQEWKSYLEKDCIEWLKLHLDLGKETLLRTEPPVVTMSSRTEVEDGMEMYVCRVDGFYPREIYASWRRDGEEWLKDTFHGSVAPNADGTYHYWLSIWIDPKESSRYWCHVEHDSLQEPLDVALKAPKSNMGFYIGYLIVGLVLACVIVGTLIFFKKRQDTFRAAPGSSRLV